MPESLITVKQLADALNVSVQWVYWMVERRGLPYFRVGPNSIRFDRLEVMAWLEARHHRAETVVP